LITFCPVLLSTTVLVAVMERRNKFDADDRASLPYPFVKSAGVIGSDDAPPQQTTAKKSALATTDW